MAKHPDYLFERKGTFYYKRRVPEGLRHKPVRPKDIVVDDDEPYDITDQ